jgi:hypothetical protein
MQISYNQNPIMLDQKMTQEATQFQPNISYYADPEKYYTLIMYDPDAVTSTNNFVHWTVTNIKGNQITSGNPLLPYYGPHPPPGSGTHHYIFELFKQDQPTSISVTLSEVDREISKEELYNKLGLTGKTPEQTTQFIVEAQAQSKAESIGGKNLNIKRKTKTIKRKKKQNNKKKTKRTTRKNKNRNKNSKKKQ